MGVIIPILGIVLASFFSLVLSLTGSLYEIPHKPAHLSQQSKDLGTILFCANSSDPYLIGEFLDSVQIRLPRTRFLQLEQCDSLRSVDSYLGHPTTRDVFGGIIFDQPLDVSSPGSFSYILLFNDTQWSLSSAYDPDPPSLVVLNQVVLSTLSDLLSDQPNPICNRSDFENINYVETIPEDISEYTRSQPFFLATSVALLIPFFVHWASMEKEKGLKSLLQMSGVSPAMYWLSRLLTDSLFSYFLLGFQWLCVGILSRESSFIENDPIVSILLCVLYAPVIVLFSFLFSFLFKKDEDAVNYSQMLVSVCLGLSFLVFGFLLDYNVPPALQLVLSVLPFYSFYYGLIVLGTAVRDHAAISFWDVVQWKQYGAQIAALYVIMFVEIVLFFLLLVGIELCGFWRKRPKELKELKMTSEEELLLQEGDQELREMMNVGVGRLTESEEEGEIVGLAVGEEEKEEVDVIGVVEEREQIENDDPTIREVLGLDEVHKAYQSGSVYRHVIRGVSFCVRKGEIYGLLGPNGSGKSTLMKITMGDLSADTGRISLDGQDIFHGGFFRSCTSGSRSSAALSIVPQESVVWEHLSAWKQVRLFGLLRGLYSSRHTQEVFDTLDMAEDRNKKPSDLSGGTQRKLQLGMGIIGEPSILLLDEPTTGIDMRTRRFVWDKLEALKGDRAILLTTHSMEEADSVCSRIGILVNGKIQAEGTTTSLKSRYGSYYRLMLQVVAVRDRSQVEDSLQEAIANLVIVQSAGRVIHAKVPMRDPETQELVPLSRLFDVVEALRLGDLREVLVDYTISHATLEQVFLSFARHQVAPKDN